MRYHIDWGMCSYVFFFQLVLELTQLNLFYCCVGYFLILKLNLCYVYLPHVFNVLNADLLWFSFVWEEIDRKEARVNAMRSAILETFPEPNRRLLQR